MQNSENKCNQCHILNEFIEKNVMRCDTSFDLALEVADFIKNCPCELEDKDEEYCNL